LAPYLKKLALLYQNQGKYNQAESLFIRVLTINESSYGKTHSFVASDLMNLAELFRLRKENDQALHLYNRVLSIWEEILGESPEMNSVLDHMADKYEALKKKKTARKLRKRARDIRKKYNLQEPVQ